MIGGIVGGRVVLELSASEARALYAAVDHEVERYLGVAARLDQDADALVRSNSVHRRRNMRAAGELRNEAAGYRAIAKDAGDLKRALLPLVTDKDAR